ncbi:MAG: exopolyphosphatase [Owenweeksia sp.]|nr:exopolyphosphatase [Owenweeksia sp.]
MKIHKLAGIDIGSNSIRLLVSNVITDKSHQQVVFKKSSLTRLPVRLGPDAFKRGEIGARILSACYKACRPMCILWRHGDGSTTAPATSALREASNGPEVTSEIFRQTGIKIDLIDGKEEARIIFNPEMIENISELESSFTLTWWWSMDNLFFNMERMASRSFKVGTIRLLKGIVSDEDWQEMKEWILEHGRITDELLMVGSGGNINRTFKLSGNKMGVPLKRKYIKKT